MAIDNDGPEDAIESEAGIGIQLARATLGDLVLRAGYGNERITLTRKGKPVAVIIGLKDSERLRALDTADATAA